jgi:hypothetical protein
LLELPAVKEVDRVTYVTTNDDPPKDLKNVIYWTCFVYGFAMLISWNAVLSTMPFFEEELPGTNIIYMISFAMNGVMVGVCILCVIIGDPS